MKYTVHEAGICESKSVGDGTRIWAFAHVLPGAKLGTDCNICDHVFIENDVVIGDRVTIKCGVQIWDGLRIEDDVFIGPNATFTNDRFPRSKAYLDKPLETRICAGASIGANATVLPGLIIGANAMVGAGSVVTKSVPANAIVVGNPARISGYVDQQGSAAKQVKISNLRIVNDPRGDLTVGEFSKDIPFEARRYFFITNVPKDQVRGLHAHRQCHQFLICAAGACSVIADDGEFRNEYRLDRPDMGLYLPPMVWGEQCKFTPEAVLVVFASDFYDESDYIKSYEDFLRERKRPKI